VPVVFTITATCPAPGKASGGGVLIPLANLVAADITPGSSYPSAANAWTASVIAFNATAATVTTYVICVQ
jgi:hypothetical protein